MSFFKRLTNILSAQSTPSVKSVKKTPKPKPVSKPAVSSEAVKAQILQAQTKAKELIVEAKDKAFQLKRQADADAQKIIRNAQILKEQALKKSAEVDHRLGAVEQREKSTVGQERRLSQELKKLEQTKRQLLEKLKAIAKLTQDEAQKLILEKYSQRMTRDIAQTIKQAEEKAKVQAEEKAKEILVEAMRHGATDYVAEYTVSIVKLKDDDIKGRIIGREGRNIRTFEKITGVEVNLDEEGIIRLSCFDSVRREIARVTLEKLMADGRIQPSRIEETFKRVSEETKRIMRQAGEKLCHDVKVFNLPMEIIDTLGRFKYRFSYGQSMITHTLEEVKIGIKLAHEVGANVNIVRLGCLLHDIGKVINDEDGTHVEIGVKFLKKFRIPQQIIDCVAEHHEDKPFSSIESTLVYVADAISGSRPGARYEDHEGYLERMTQLEDIAKSFKGVQKAYAVQAGREVRVIVDPQQRDDDASIKLSNDIKNKIKKEVKDFPGNIKVIVIRETRTEVIV